MFIDLLDNNNTPILINTKNINLVRFDIKSYDIDTISFKIEVATDYGKYCSFETYTELPKFLIGAEISIIQQIYIGALSYILNERHEKTVDKIDDLTIELSNVVEQIEEIY